jgi:Family of unknown function (DUF6502)
MLPSDVSIPTLRTPPANLLVACRRLLRPLVRLMMRSGVTLPVLTDLLRQLFVEVAVTDILTEPKARTDSRISLLTGIHRKEIRRDRAAQAEGAHTKAAHTQAAHTGDADTGDAHTGDADTKAAHTGAAHTGAAHTRGTQPGGANAGLARDRTTIPEAVTITSQIIARWLGSPPFVDAAGRPRPLPRVAAPGSSDASFDQLVASVTTDIRARAVLDDWRSRGIVQMTPADHIVLNAEAFIPRPGGAEQLFYFARNLHDHVAAAVANISAGDVAPFLDRSVHYDELTLDQARALEAYARATAVRALLDVNRRALELVGANNAADRTAPDRIGSDRIAPDSAAPDQTSREPATPDGQPVHRVNFGVFVFGDSDAPAAEPNQTDGAAE